MREEKERCMMVCPAAFNREHHCPGRLGSNPQVWLHPGCTAAGHCVREECVDLRANVRALVCLCERASEQVSE